MKKRAVYKGYKKAYFNFISKNPQVKQALYKEAAVGPWGAAAMGAVGGAGLGAGGYKLYDMYKQRQEEEAMNAELAQMQAAIPQENYYYGGAPNYSQYADSMGFYPTEYYM